MVGVDDVFASFSIPYSTMVQERSELMTMLAASARAESLGWELALALD